MFIFLPTHQGVLRLIHLLVTKSYKLWQKQQRSGRYTQEPFGTDELFIVDFLKQTAPGLFRTRPDLYLDTSFWTVSQDSSSQLNLIVSPL